SMERELCPAIVDMMAVVDLSLEETPQRTFVQRLDQPEKRAAGFPADRQEIGIFSHLVKRLIDELLAQDQPAFESQIEGRVGEQVGIEAVCLVDLGKLDIDGPIEERLVTLCLFIAERPVDRTHGKELTAVDERSVDIDDRTAAVQLASSFRPVRLGQPILQVL